MRWDSTALDFWGSCVPFRRRCGMRLQNRSCRCCGEDILAVCDSKCLVGYPYKLVCCAQTPQDIDKFCQLLLQLPMLPFASQVSTVLMRFHMMSIPGIGWTGRCHKTGLHDLRLIRVMTIVSITYIYIYIHVYDGIFLYIYNVCVYIYYTY